MEGTENGLPAPLHKLEESLRCSICKDIYQSAVTIADRKCGHSFCSECIRKTFRDQMMKSLSRKRQCPNCRFSDGKVENLLLPNLALQQAVIAWRILAPTLGSPGKYNESTDSTPRLRPRLEWNDTSTNDTPKQNVCQSLSVSLQRRPQISFKGMKKTRLKELCENDRLSSTGSEDELKSRLQLFIDLWNANMDDTVPKTHQAIVREVEERERRQRKEKQKEFLNGTNKHNQLVKNMLKNGSSGDSAFDKEWHQGYKELIASVKDRRSGKGTDKSACDPQNNNAGERKENSEFSSNRQVFANQHPSPTCKGEKVAQDITNKITQAKPSSNSVEIIDLAGGADSLDDVMSPKTNPSARPGFRTPSNANHPRVSSPTTMNSSSRPKKRICSASKSFNANKRSIAGPWTCSRCTFRNETRTWSTAQCEMCNGNRPT